jgi:hypothetical protein
MLRSSCGAGLGWHDASLTVRGEGAVVGGNQWARAWHGATIRILVATGIAGLLLLLAAGGASAGEPQSPLDVQPFLRCVTANPDGTVTAWFGYVNGTGSVLSIPPGEGNSIDPTTYLDLLPSEFAPGRTDDAFTVTFPEPGVVVWNLNGQSSSASAASEPCLPPSSSPSTTSGSPGSGSPPSTAVPPASKVATTAEASPATTSTAPAKPPTSGSAGPGAGAAPAQPSTGRGSGVRGASVSGPAPARPARAAPAVPPAENIASLNRSNAVPALAAGLILVAIATAGVAAGRYRRYSPRH